MKNLARLFVLLLAVSTLLHAQLAGTWKGAASYKGQQVPITVEFTGSGGGLHAALRNGPESSPASSATLSGNHLLLTFDYFARTLDATLTGDTLAGTFGSATTRIPVRLQAEATGTASRDARTAIGGDWEIAVKSSKGESAWQLRVDADTSGALKAVIQRIDGDTGVLYGTFGGSAKSYRVSHFTAAGPALYELTPQADGTLLVSNLLNAEQTNLTARRPAEARQQSLPPPTEATQQTTIKDPAAPFRFSFPDLSGKQVANTDARFEGKVMVVAIGGSWCPNCHDEAPMLESLYKRFHGLGLEVIDLSFEEADQLKDPARLRAFIARYGITYTVLLAGEPEQLNQKITLANNLNCWPTSFFLGRDGRVREVHAGFVGPANPTAHAQLEQDTTALIKRLLAEPAPTHNASR